MARNSKGKSKEENTVVRLLLEKDYSNTDFAMGRYVEDAVCFVKSDCGFEVYTACRGRKEDLSLHMDFKEAVLAFLKELCCDDKEASKIYEEFIVNVG